MAEAGNASRTPGSGGADDKGGQGNRKFAGKYDSMEDAVDKGIGGLEKGFHETREELGAIKQMLERAITPIGSRGRDDDYNDDGYGRGRSRQDPDDDFDETEFIASPKRILKQREEKLQQKLEANLARRNQAMINNAAQVLRWQMQNPDLDEHETLVESFYKRTDANKPVYQRLKEAGQQTKAYLKKLKGEDSDDEDRRNAGRSPNSDEYVEGSAGAGRGNKQSRSDEDDDAGKDNSPGSIYGDAELAQEIEERRRFKSSRFQAKSAK